MKIHAFYADSYQLVARVINLMRVFPFSNAIVEKYFSTMNKKIKTDWRSNLEIQYFYVSKKWGQK